METKYSKERLQDLVKESKSVSDLMRKIGLKITGGSHGYLSKKIEKFEIDTSHFDPKSTYAAQNRPKKKTCDEILKFHDKDFRRPGHLLRRALIESGIEEKCSICSVGAIWNDQKLVLQVDHINGDIFDNTKENLRFLCPNCHSQTMTWCSKNRKK